MEMTIVEAKPSIKLVKGSSYVGWEIKVFREEGMTMDQVITEIERLHSILVKKYGDINGNKSNHV